MGCLLCFACTCCCTVTQSATYKNNQRTTDEVTVSSTITGVTTTTDNTITTLKPGCTAHTFAQKNEGSKTTKQSDEPLQAQPHPMTVCIQSTIKLSIANDGSANVKSINVETSVGT